MREKRIDFEPGDKVRVEGHEGHGKVVSIEPIGDDQFRVELFYPDNKEYVVKMYPFTEIVRVPEIVERVKSLDFDPSYKYDLFMDSMRFSLAYKYDPLFSLSSTQIDVYPHQIEAVYNRILDTYRLRFLLADDAGLGKTIMTGMLLKELEMRNLIDRVLLVVPAPLQAQWRRELREKFNEEFTIYHSGYLGSLSLSPTENPWEKQDRIITSIDYAKNPETREALVDTDWDLIVFDEAHHLSAYRDGKKTNRYELADSLRDKSEGLLLLTATPHKGDTYAFFALLNLLDSDYFPDEEFVDRGKLSEVMIRRLKEEVTDFDGKALFLPRNVETLPIEFTPPEWELYQGVTKYVSEGYDIAMKEKRRSVGFAMVILQKRMVSSVYSIKKSLENRKARLQRLKGLLKKGKAVEELTREEQTILDRYVREPEMITDEQKEDLERKLEVLAAATSPEGLGWEIDQISNLIEKAESIEVDSKVEKLVEFVEETLREDPVEKVLIFSEYRDTVDYLVGIFQEKGYDPAIIHGNMDMWKREEEEDKFRRKETNLMIATDAAREGLNLQFCHVMVNYELPWNPTKIEQRMGRLHRLGQDRQVWIFNLMVQDTREAEIFDVILSKLDAIRREMGERTFDVMGELLSGVDVQSIVMRLLSEREKDREVIEQIEEAIERRKEEISEKIEKESLIKDKLNLEPLKDLITTSAEESIEEGDLARFVKTLLENIGG
ncbi:MAG: DEAD/DEAH box helicase, partial [Thermoplasmata archaeon]